MCGRELPWAVQPLVSVYWRLRGCVSNERSGRGTSLWVCLLWSVGASDVVSVCARAAMGV